MRAFDSVADLTNRLTELRVALEPAFSPETALGGAPGAVPSAGQCAAVAAIVNWLYGGGLVSANHSGQSHWFNRFNVDGRLVDIDITGDQFGLKAIRAEAADHLFSGTRVRRQEELNAETRSRAKLLAERAGLKIDVPVHADSAGWAADADHK